MQITIKYGPDTHVITPFNQPTIQALKRDQTARAVLGYGDNVRALIDGVEQPDGVLVPDGALVTMETKCNTKAQPTQ